MSIINISQNYEDYLNIKLKSEAYEDGIPYFYKENPEKYYQDISEIHKVLYRLDKNKPLSMDIYYEPLNKEDFLDEMVDLHKEWFPFSYDRNYFKKYILRQKYIAIGAFMKIGIKAYLIGFIIGEIVSEEKFKNSVPGVLAERGWYDFITPWVNCGYLQSLGVIDEYRKLNVGTRLLELFIEETRKRKVVAIYSNVIIHNNSAIKFMEANNWHYYGIEKNYYRFNDKIFDAKVFYYILDASWCQLHNLPKSNGHEEIEKDESGEIQELNRREEKGCLASVLGIFGYSNSNDINTSTISPININDENKD